MEEVWIKVGVGVRERVVRGRGVQEMQFRDENYE